MQAGLKVRAEDMKKLGYEAGLGACRRVQVCLHWMVCMSCGPVRASASLFQRIWSLPETPKCEAGPDKPRFLWKGMGGTDLCYNDNNPLSTYSAPNTGGGLPMGNPGIPQDLIL